MCGVRGPGALLVVWAQQGYCLLIIRALAMVELSSATQGNKGEHRLGFSALPYFSR